LSDNVANQETDELVTAERHEAETFGEDGNRTISQEHLEVAPTSFVEPEIHNTLQVVSLVIVCLDILMIMFRYELLLLSWGGIVS